MRLIGHCFLDLEPPLNILRNNLDQKWRNQLNRAEKNKLNIIEGSGDDFYNTFLMLQEEMLQRKKYIPGIRLSPIWNNSKRLA